MAVNRSHVWIASSILAGVAIVLSAASTYAQRRPPGTALLSQMSGQAIQGLYRSLDNWDISIGREIFGATALLHDSNATYSSSTSIDRSRPAEVTLRLSSTNQAPQYRRLTLAFGVADDNYHARHGTVTRLSIYRDGQFHGYTDILLGQRKLWVIDVSNTRSIALEASCTRSYYDRCAGIFFFEEILEP